MHGIAAGRILLSVTLVASLTLAPGGCGPSGDDQAASAALPAAAQPAATAQPAAGHPPVDAPVAQKFAPGEGPRIQGTVALDAQFAAAAAGHPLLVILRSKEGRGMPIAVLSIDDPVFPVTFDLGPEHAPLQSDDTPEILKAENKLLARLSVSGSMLGGAEDIESEPVLVQAGAPAVTLTLDHRRGP